MAEGWKTITARRTPSCLVSWPLPPNFCCASGWHWQIQLPCIKHCRGSQPPFQPQCLGYIDRNLLRIMKLLNLNLVMFSYLTGFYSCQFLPALLGQDQMVRRRRWRLPWVALPHWCVKSSRTLLHWSPGSKMADHSSPVRMPEFFQVIFMWLYFKYTVNSYRLFHVWPLLWLGLHW